MATSVYLQRLSYINNSTFVRLNLKWDVKLVDIRTNTIVIHIGT